MPASSTYPSLERKKGGPDNWIEAAGGLPSYIERIAKHLHYEKGKSISSAIAMAVNTVKKWCATGRNHNGGELSAKTKAQACKAVASWESKKGRSKAKSLSEAIDVMPAAWQLELAGVLARERVSLSEAASEAEVLDCLIEALVGLEEAKRGARQAKRLADGTFAPKGRGSVRQAINDAMGPTAEARWRHLVRSGEEFGPGFRIVKDEKGYTLRDPEGYTSGGLDVSRDDEDSAVLHFATKHGDLIKNPNLGSDDADSWREAIRSGAEFGEGFTVVKDKTGFMLKDPEGYNAGGIDGHDEDAAVEHFRKKYAEFMPKRKVREALLAEGRALAEAAMARRGQRQGGGPPDPR